MSRWNSRDDRQELITDWVTRWGAAVFIQPLNRKLRALRLLEEAIELCQCSGVMPTDIGVVMERVYSRPMGQHHQELGGVALTLLAAAESWNCSADLCEVMEIRRIMAIPDQHFVDKNREKILAMPSIHEAREVEAAHKGVPIR
jgi:hypothetical protein